MISLVPGARKTELFYCAGDGATIEETLSKERVSGYCVYNPCVHLLFMNTYS